MKNCCYLFLRPKTPGSTNGLGSREEQKIVYWKARKSALGQLFVEVAGWFVYSMKTKGYTKCSTLHKHVGMRATGVISSNTKECLPRWKFREGTGMLQQQRWQVP